MRAIYRRLPFALRCGAIVLVTSLVRAGGGPCLGEALAGLAPDKLKLLTFELDDARISVDAIAAPEGPVVTLRGDVNTGKEKRNLLERAEKVVAGVATLRDRIFVKSPADPGTPEPEVTDFWVLTYIRSHVSPVTGNGAAPSAPDNVDTLVTALDSVYGPLSVQRAGLGRLMLHGSGRQVLAIKRFLSLLDAPWPQVQMNVWAVQVSGAPADVSARMRGIGDQIGAVRDEIADVQRSLARIVVRQDDPADAEHWKRLEPVFAMANIELSEKRSLSLNESLLLLTLHPRRAQKVKDLRDYVRNHCAEWTRALGPEPAAARKHGCEDADFVPFRRLADLLAGEYDVDLESFLEFGQAAYCFTDKARWPYRPDAPRRLMRTGATVDRILKSVMDAFAADMNDLFFDPLLDRIQRQGTGGRKSDGVALVGRTRIVVTSGLEAGLAPEMASFVESGRPRPFGKELLDLAFPASRSGAGADDLTGGARALAGLSGAQALGLAALLSSDAEPAYTKVAPGIALSVRPTVLPDGGAARVTVDARFGVASTPLDQSRQDIWRAAPPAGIAGDSVHTDAAVSAFDLFDISSFSVSVSHPRTPFYIPILGRLPVIGPAFQIPRRDQETLFESLILVNTVILPRSIELQRFYGRETDPPPVAGIDCREEVEESGKR
jgi:hypothetical protein